LGPIAKIVSRHQHHRASGRSAELVRRRAEPIRQMLEEMGDDITQRQ
jgi:hypothetical protein